MKQGLKILVLAALCAVVAASLWHKLRVDTGATNLCVHQAKAFLQGRLDIDPTLSQVDLARHNGCGYVVFPPFPALVLAPLVAVFDVDGVRPVLISILLSLLNILVLKKILQALAIEAEHIPWILAAFFLGTAYWLAVLWSSGVWFTAHIMSVTAMLLAIREALGKGRGLLVGLFCGLAFLSRQLTIYSSVFLLCALWLNPRHAEGKGRAVNCVGFAFAVGLCLGAYLLFNWLRFGDAFETGYAFLNLHNFQKARVDQHGMFSLAYMPFNFCYMFLQGFHLEFGAQDYLSLKRMDPFGTSITFASPFVFFAFLARWRRPLVAAAWVSIGLTLAHFLLYFNNGFCQINAQRFTLDFFPVLIVLTALGISQANARLFKAAVAYSVGLNILAFGLTFLRETWLR